MHLKTGSLQNVSAVTGYVHAQNGKTYAVNVMVNYANAKIEDNESFVAGIQPQLQAGVPTGWDLIVLTDWMAGRLIRLGYVDELNKENIPNWVNLREDLKNVAFDPGRKYSLPWQSGFAGLGYNIDKIQNAIGKDKIESLDDLWNPALKGQVTVLSEMRDTIGVIEARTIAACLLFGAATALQFQLPAMGINVPTAFLLMLPYLLALLAVGLVGCAAAPTLPPAASIACR